MLVAGFGLQFIKKSENQNPNRLIMLMLLDCVCGCCLCSFPQNIDKLIPIVKLLLGIFSCVVQLVGFDASLRIIRVRSMVSKMFFPFWEWPLFNQDVERYTKTTI